jgi:4-amino-4-deoxy-L-arabinose transferase-like glycosyltransferase
MPRGTWAVAALGLALRLAWVATLDDRLPWPDEQEYAAIGRSLAAGEGYVSTSYRANPGVPAFLAASFRLFGPRPWPARVGQAVAGALTCVALVGIGTRAVSPAVGLVAGALLAVYPAHVYVAGVFYPTCLATAWAALAVWLALRARRTRDAAASGLAWGAAVLTLPSLLLLGPCLAVGWLLDRRHAVARIAALLAGWAVVVLPWTARNAAVYGRVVLVSSGGGITLWKGNNPLSDGGPDDRFLGWDRPVWRARLAALDPATRAAVETDALRLRADAEARTAVVGDGFLARDDVLGPAARAYIRRAPLAALRRAGWKVVTLWSAFSRTYSDNAPPGAARVAAVTFYPLLLLAAGGAVVGLPRHRGLVVPALLVVGFTATHALLTTCTRLRLPIDPYVILFAAVALVSIGARLTGDRGASAASRADRPRPHRAP